MRIISGAILACLVAGAALAAEPAKMDFPISHPAVGVGEELYLYFVPKRLGIFAGLNVASVRAILGLLLANS